MHMSGPMNITWEYPLPTNEHSHDVHFESPVAVTDDFVCFVSQSVRMPGRGTVLHVVNRKSGKGIPYPLSEVHHLLSKDFFVLTYHRSMVWYTGDFLLLQGDMLQKTLPFCEKGIVTSYLQDGCCLYVSCQQHKRCSLCCIDLEQLSLIWEMDISNTKPYRAGELSFCNGNIACYGRDQLLLIQPENGEILRTIRIPRIDKLFCPLRLDADTLLIGYTNWSTAGILKYQISTQKVLWRHKRKFDGPQLRCRIYRREECIYWVKNDTELIGVDIHTGAEQVQQRTSPWLYTNLRSYRNGFLYGTAGADGYLNYFDCTTKQLKWTVFLKNGCAFYDIRTDAVFVGDYDKSIKQISAEDGRIRQAWTVDGEVVGQIAVYDDCLYTVLWGNAKKDVRLVQIGLT